MIPVSKAKLHGLCRTQADMESHRQLGDRDEGTKSRERRGPALRSPLLFCAYTPPVGRVPVLKSDTPGRFEKSVVPPFPLVA